MSTIPANPFILIDGSSYLYRAFYALPPLSNSKGQPTGAIYGVINMIRRLIKDYQPHYLAVVFDAKGKTFRDELFEAYKSHRAPMPQDLQSQIKPLMDIVTAMGLPLLIIEGVEADDVIATLAIKAVKEEHHVLISTGDKDMAQIVNQHITLINTMSGTLLDPEGVKKKFGVEPQLMVDYLALVGDKIDNIPGIPKVGPKTAVKWLDEYGSLDNLVAHADNIKGKVGENLRAHLQELPLSQQLATVKKDVPLHMQISDLSPKEPHRKTLIQLYQQFEFRLLLEEQLQEESHVQKKNKNYQIIDSEEKLERWIAQMEKADLIAVDTETDNLDYMQANLVGLSFAISPNKAVYIPVAHDYDNVPTQLDRDYVLKKLRKILENPSLKKVGHNLKYDKTILSHYDIHLQGIHFDTMLESYVLNSSATRHDMDSLALKYLGYSTLRFEDVAGKGIKQKTFNQVSLDMACDYAAEDADVTLQLHQHLWPKINKEPGLKKVFTDIEVPLLSVLSHMENHGVLIDQKALALQSKSIGKRLKEIQEQAYQLAKQEFNLDSPKQLQDILFTKMQLPILRKTSKGQASTAEAVLQELALNYPLPKLLLEYRGLAKLKSTYTDTLPKQINQATGRVHTSYNQAVAATGRLSSTNPNLQNIPIRNEAGRRIRQAFIAPPGYKILAADYSQIELRIMAHLSQDKSLLKAFADGEDIHRATASEVFSVDLENVTKEQRRHAKAINFGLIYGMSAFGLGQQLSIDSKTAEAYMNLYFQRYPGVKTYMEETRTLAFDQGYVETLYGRRLYLPEIHSTNLQRRRAAERAAINAPMQGTAADIIKLAMIAMDKFLQQKKIKATMIMQVHDELVFEVNKKDIENLKDAVNKMMTLNNPLTIPLAIGIGVGDNWDEAH